MPNTPNGIYYPPQGAPATLRSFFTNLATTADAALTTLRQDLTASILGTRAIADNAISAVALFTGAPVGRIRMRDGGQVIVSNENVGTVLQLTLTQQPTTSAMRPAANTRLVATRSGPHLFSIAGGFEPINTPTGIRAFEVRVNADGVGTAGYRAGERQVKSVAGTDGRAQTSYTFIANLVAGDRVELYGIQSQGVGVTVSQQTELSLYWLRPSL